MSTLQVENPKMLRSARSFQSFAELISLPKSKDEFEWPTPIIPPPVIDEPDDYLRSILNARVYDVAIQSPLHYCTKLSEKLGNSILLKREDLQPIFSFKLRGSFNRLYNLTPEEKERGVCCVSAGNHAQGIALGARQLGIKAVIVMPKFAPEIKVENVKRLGAEVVLHGNNFDEAKLECARIVKEHNRVFISPYDGTVGTEILSQIMQTRLDAIFVGAGGGGLLAGIAAYVKQVRPEIKIIGVNTYESDSMYQSLLKGKPVEIKRAGLFSDGSSVRLAGTENVKLCKKYVDDMVLVSNDELCAAIKDAFNETRTCLEPAGALSLAGLKKYLQANPNLKDGIFCAVNSGANMNFDRLRFVATRASIGEGREALTSVLIPEEPGSMYRFYSIISPRTVKEISYRWTSSKNAHVFTAYDTEGYDDRVKIIKQINDAGFTAFDITDNGLASNHIRYLSGGKSPTHFEELLLRFRMAELPSAIYNITEAFQDKNITLFHYRNHGADYGRCLLGLGISRDKKPEIIEVLLQAGHQDIVDESENPVYKNFLE